MAAELEDPAGPSITEREPPRTIAPDARRSSLVAAVTALAIAVSVIVRNWPLIGRAVYEDGDFAANSLLIDRAKHLTLLTGNYSRVGFHHPGPALLWVQGASELVFRDLLGAVDTPYNAHVLGIILLEATTFYISLRIVMRWFASPLAVAAFGATMFTVISFQDGVQGSTWMPHIYIWPFLLFTVASISLLDGRLTDIWAYVLASVLLIHGHVSFITNVAVMTLAILALTIWRWRRCRDRLDLPTPRVMLATAAIVAIGAAPMIANLVLHFPGDWKNYWSFSHSSATGGNPLRGSARLVLAVWNGNSRWGALLAVASVALLLLVARSSSGLRRLIRASIIAFAVITATVLFYVVRGVDDLAFTYVVIYYVAVPMTAAGLIVAACVERTRAAAARPLAIATIAGTLLFTSATSAVANPYRGAAWLPDALASVEREAGTRSMVALDFETPGWPAALGVLEYARRHGAHACVVNPVWAFLATKEEICRPDELQGALEVRIDDGNHSAGADAGRTVYANPAVEITVAP